MIIWKDINVPIFHKTTHVRKIGGRLRRSFIRDSGDIPILRFNAVTRKFEQVVNNRGRAYAARKRLRHRGKAKRRTG